MVRAYDNLNKSGTASSNPCSIPFDISDFVFVQNSIEYSVRSMDDGIIGTELIRCFHCSVSYHVHAAIISL